MTTDRELLDNLMQECPACRAAVTSNVALLTDGAVLTDEQAAWVLARSLDRHRDH
jgi:hypothetical protein